MGSDTPCACGAVHRFVAGEQVPEHAGAGDFDRALEIKSGPGAVGRRMFLGGVAEIGIGKLEGKPIQLVGSSVSRNHCKLVRLDFGPSRWSVEDCGSSNGTFVNGAQVIDPVELKTGDTLRVGEFVLQLVDCDPASQPVAGSFPCKTCGATLPPATLVCVHCGTDQKTGRRLVISKGLDEDKMAEASDAIIKFVSWFIWVGFFPIASEAMGRFKAHLTWVLVTVTAVLSLAFMVAVPDDETEAPHALQNLMLWSGRRDSDDPRVNEVLKLIEAEKTRDNTQPGGASTDDAPGDGSGDEDLADIRDVQELLDAVAAASVPAEVGFRPWQLVTHAFLHDPSSVLGFVFHFAGNLLFLLVFGLRVNECIGGLRFAIVYPLLAIGAGAAHMLASASAPLHPMLGASGAVMGLAGMYLVLFPVQRVHAAIWLRGMIFTAWQCLYTLFAIRGYWLLLILIVWNDILPLALQRLLHYRGSTAHFAHLGGFATGMLLAAILLLTKQAHSHGGDLISMLLGRRATGLVRSSGSMTYIRCFFPNLRRMT